MIDLEDDELLDRIARKGRMMRALSKIQALYINEAKRRGIDSEEILNAVRTNPQRSEAERVKSRSSSRKNRGNRADG